MGAEGKKENSFILQAGVLAMAGIIVRIIGMLYRSPLTAIIGDEGNVIACLAEYLREERIVAPFGTVANGVK